MERGGEKQVAFARTSRSFVTPAPSDGDFCCRRIAPLLICECGGRAEGLGLPLRCVAASCLVWPGLGYTSSAPDLRWQQPRLITTRRFTSTPSSATPPPAPPLPLSQYLHTRKHKHQFMHASQVKERISVEDTRCDFRWSPAGWMYQRAAAAAAAGAAGGGWWCDVLEITLF